MVSFVEFLMTRWKFCSTPCPSVSAGIGSLLSPMAATQVHLAQANRHVAHVALATCHPPYPTPSSATRTWGPLGMCYMLRNATFLGFFEILGNRDFDASS